MKLIYMKNCLSIIASFVFISLFISCKNKNDKKISETDNRPYFEGEIELEVTQGLYGKLFKQNTSYYISENIFKREQKLGGVNKVFDNYAGIIIDLKKDSVVLYYVSNIQNIKNKHTLSISAYKNYLDANNIPTSGPSPFDLTFQMTDGFKLIKQKKDSLKINNFLCDYSLYKDSNGITKQEIFDTREIKVKRALLEMVFINIPSEINFPLQSEIKTTVSDITNDTILNGQQTKRLESLAHKIFTGKDSPDSTKPSLEKISKNKWINLGLKVFKKGVDMNLHISTTPTKVIKRVLTQIEQSLGLEGFVEIESLDEFINSLPKGGGDFDD